MNSQRLDKWLWYARFFKSRSLATKFCGTKRFRINEQIIAKPHHALHVGDVLTFPKGPHIRVIKVLGLGTRRGPAVEAQALYDDLDPPQSRRKDPFRPAKTAKRDPGAGRPTKRERRDTDKFKRRGEE